LVTAAAQTWNVPENSLTTEKGAVLHKASNRRATYGSLVDKAAALPVPKDVKLKDPKTFTLMGTDVPRLDIPEKVNGSAIFGIDVKLPGLLTARVARSPVFGGKLKNCNDTKAKAIPGVKEVVNISNGIAVVADNYYSATKGIQALEIEWDEGPLAQLTSPAIMAKYAELAKQPGKMARNQGNADAAYTGAPKKFERVYEGPFLAHATMEPMNATADVRANSCDVYVPTQGQTACHMAAIAASGLPADKVKIHTTYLGGGFGRRGEADYVTEAVEISKIVKAPVKVIWSREDDMQHDFYRPISYARMTGAVDASGKATVFTQHLVQQSLMKRLGSLPPNGVDFISMDGAATLPYDIPNIKVEYTEQDPGVPYGFWRSVGASFQGFAVEAFVDELASTAGKDPYEFRKAMLTSPQAKRHLAALNLAAEKAGWGKPLPAGHARGIAVMEAFGSILSQVTEVSVDAKGAVKVHRVVVSVDCGWVINPDTIRQQMEGGTIYGLSAALKGEITINKGRVVQRHFNDYQVVRHSEMPKIEVYLVPSLEEPGGIGEPSTALAAGSLVNAIYAATGKRIYKLPVKPDMLVKTA
ncbi:MAG TPA: molybdopterin cofactor-binding domain-containing protein, partial [Vicinamibacterales bacterium]|nr:molybdopterin cofactor-binding domain-containing protein [Vicinamibacterales bacterium]